MFGTDYFLSQEVTSSVEAGKMIEEFQLKLAIKCLNCNSLQKRLQVSSRVKQSKCIGHNGMPLGSWWFEQSCRDGAEEGSDRGQYIWLFQHHSSNSMVNG